MHETDVIVIGSGAAGLIAALTAASEGLEVTLIEKTGLIGGTSAVSGGTLWVPANRWLLEQGRQDSRDEALTYLKHITLDMVDEEMLAVFLDNVNPMVDLIEKHTKIEFDSIDNHPDYQPHLPGASEGGRTVQLGLFDSSQLGASLRDRLRKSSSGLPVTIDEVEKWGSDSIDKWDWELLARRISAGIVGMGSALVGELLLSATRLGVRVHVNAPAQELIRDAVGRVSGVKLREAGVPATLNARRGVVLASGGFEWNPKFVRQFLGVPMVAPGSPPGNTGDGLAMSMAIGANLGNMSEAWWDPMIEPTGDTYDGVQLFRPTSSLRTLPGGIIVNKNGLRFVNEAMNYNDMGKALTAFDPQTYSYPNLPCWLIFDDRFRKSYSIGSCSPSDVTPPWIYEAATLPELALLVGIDQEGLTQQVLEYNTHAAQGEDPIFHRGESIYDTFRGDPTVKPHRNIRPLESGPYYAVEMQSGSLGTKGGPMTDSSGQVVDPWNEPISGLYACGNVAASVFGAGYPGAGATLSSGMVFGFLAGRALANE